MTTVDPVTTDPKGEVGRAAGRPQIHAPHNTPALTRDKGAYGARQARSFAGFVEVCRMIEQGDHLRREGLTRIIAIAYDINVGKRRYSRQELLRALGEVKG